MICIIENVQTCFSLRAIYLRQWASQVVLVIKNLPANAGDIRGTDWISGKIPWRRAQQLTPVFSLRESPWTREPDAQQSLGSIYCYYSIFPGTSLVAQLVKNPHTMLRPQFNSWVEDPLEKGQTTHSIILWLPWWLRW